MMKGFALPHRAGPEPQPGVLPKVDEMTVMRPRKQDRGMSVEDIAARMRALNGVELPKAEHAVADIDLHAHLPPAPGDAGVPAKLFADPGTRGNSAA